MIKNINDLLSFIVLVILTLYSQSFLVFANIKTKKYERVNDEHVSKFQLFMDYNDNVEE